MNYWTELSVEFANQRNYLDELYRVYPISPNLRRSLPDGSAESIEKSFNERNNKELVKELLKLELFPIKDSYVPYLRRDSSAIERNPNTINRIAGNLYSMGFSAIIDKCTEPKETNRQMGPMFKNWLKSGVLGCKISEDEEEFLNGAENAIYLASDEKMKDFAIKHLGYTRTSKGLDFIAKFNNKFVIGEAKFLTDFGGHQNDQLEDALSTLTSKTSATCKHEVIKIAILDGVVYIKNGGKMFGYLKDDKLTILSALVLREFLYSL
ncbi:MAG: restriction endonuclease [Clostridia bacterium]|nr:restriction endonuclease [Clostridia bacterium]